MDTRRRRFREVQVEGDDPDKMQTASPPDMVTAMSRETGRAVEFSAEVPLVRQIDTVVAAGVGGGVTPAWLIIGRVRR